jgi:hypothetical protein
MFCSVAVVQMHDLTDIICRTSLLAFNVDSWQHFPAWIIIISYVAFVIVMFENCLAEVPQSYCREWQHFLTNKEVFDGNGTFGIIFSIMTKEKMVTVNQL